MGDTLITVIAIFVTAVLMFVFPLMSISARNDNITQTTVQTLTSEFVNKISTKGVITKDDYETYLSNIVATGNIYDVAIEIQILDENPNKITTTSQELIGENARYSIYTNTILDKYLNSSEEENKYQLQQGDNVIVTATNTNTTIAQSIRNFIYTMVGKDTYKISAKSASMVVHGTTRRIASVLNPGEGGETPEEPEPEKNKLERIEVMSPYKLNYNQGDKFDSEGMRVTAYYTLGESREVTNYDIMDIDTTYNVGEVAITITYAEEGITRAETFKINVKSIFEYDIEEEVAIIKGLTYVNYKKITIPSKIDGKKVTGIKRDFYRNCDVCDISDITIPYSIVTLENPVFYGVTDIANINVDAGNANYSSENGVLFNKQKTELIYYPNKKTDSSYTIPNSVTTIENYSFYRNYPYYAPYSITIPNSVTTIGNYAFYDCKFSSIKIPDNVESIGSSAFGGCVKLSNVTIPSSVISIGSFAFGNCSKLTTVCIEKGVKNIGDGAFYECKNLKNVTIPDSIISIGSFAFFNCSALTDVNIPNSVTSIGKYAFYRCYNLKSIEIPNSVESIDSIAFSECLCLKTIRVPRGMNVPSNKWGATNATIERYTP